MWFSTTARSNVDAETTAKIGADHDIPLSIIILILTVVCPFFYHIHYAKLTPRSKIEHALNEWENGQKAHKVPFAEDNAKHRFNFMFLSIDYTLLIFIPDMPIIWVIGNKWLKKLLLGLGIGCTA